MTRSILLIEDMAGVRDSLEMILNLAGYSVALAKDGKEGLDKARSGAFDLIITDILLPKLDGSEVIINLRKDGNTTPVLAISAGGSGASATQTLMLAKEKADDVMEKPFSRDELLSRINTMIE